MFTLPEDLTVLSQADLDELHAKAREYANTVLTETPNDLEALQAAKNAFDAIAAEKSSREATDALRAELTAAAAAPAVEAPEPEGAQEPEVVTEGAREPVAVTATARPARSTLDTAPDSGAEYAVMVVAPDVPNMASGMKLTSFAQAAEALTSRLKAYPKPSGRATGKKPAPSRKLGANTFDLNVMGRSFVRSQAVVLRRQFPENLTISGMGEGEIERVLKFATSEKRLPGGSLAKSVERNVANGRALTAAAGWCSPSETLYALCDLSSMDGLLDVPEIQAARGGFMVPEDGGPDFSVIWNGIGNAGNVILSEYDVQNDTAKQCFEIPCPEFTDVRLDLAYVCLTGSLLQRRTYPEVVELFSSQAMAALAHKVNAAVISRIVTASGAAVVIPADASGDDAASGILGAVDLAIEDIKYRERMSRSRTVEIVMPYWGLTQIRAAMSRRTGIGRVDVTDAEIASWFAARHATLQLVYDWQDAYSGLGTGPGGAAPLTALPTTIQFLAYPSGTWTKIVQDVVALDTIYDNAMLTTNEYTAVFAEDGFNVIQTCPVSRLYTAQADPSGVVGCCAP